MAAEMVDFIIVGGKLFSGAQNSTLTSTSQLQSLFSFQLEYSSHLTRQLAGPAGCTLASALSRTNAKS
jgi:hypothetical protein